MKKIFVLTGEPSGDKLASQVINNLKKLNPNIDYLSVGGENLKSLGIKSIYDLKEITYLGFTNVILNLFKINKKINQTVKAIENFNTDITLPPYSCIPYYFSIAISVALCARGQITFRGGFTTRKCKLTSN